MALNDLTGQQIQNTYHKLVQTDGTLIADGTGSELPIKFEGPDLIVSGALRAQSYIVSQSVINVSSGSTVFGNSSGDIHQFTGSISCSGDISASGDIFARDAWISGTTLYIGGVSVTKADLDNLKIGKSIVPTLNKESVTTEDNADNVSNSVNYIRNDMWMHKTNDESALIHNTAHSLNFRTAGGDPFRIFTDGSANNFVRLGTFAGSYIILRGNITASGHISSSGNIIADTYNAKTSGTGYKLDNAKVVYVENAKYHFGRQPAGTVISGSTIELGKESTTHISASGNISSSGYLIGIIDGRTF